ncbi:MAG: EamA family transporter [Pseudomonadota bacterium]
MKFNDNLLAILVAMVWGGSFVAIKIGVEYFPPLLFSALRFALAAFPLVFFLPPPNASWRVIFGIGFVLGVVKFSLLFVSMDVGLSAGLASLLVQSQAFFTVILAAAMLREQPSRSQNAGILVAFLGVATVATTVDANAPSQGIALILSAALAWAASNILLRHAGSVSMLNLMVWASLVPPIPVFGLSLWLEGADVGWAAVTTINWHGALALGYVTFVGTVLGFAGWGYLIARYGAGRVAPFALLVPVFGMSLSAVVFGETFGPMRLFGAALVLVGLALTIWRQPAG